MYTYKHRDWNVVCERCGFKMKASQLRKEYTGLRVCKDCWDPRHPQELRKARPDKQTVPFVSKEPTDVFVTGPDCTICDRQGIVGIGAAGCMVVGLVSNLGTLCTDEYTSTPN